MQLVALRDTQISVCLCLFLGLLLEGCQLCAKQELTEDIFSPFRNLTPKEQFCLGFFKVKYKK